MSFLVAERKSPTGLIRRNAAFFLRIRNCSAWFLVVRTRPDPDESSIARCVHCSLDVLEATLSRLTDVDDLGGPPVEVRNASGPRRRQRRSLIVCTGDSEREQHGHQSDRDQRASKHGSSPFG